MGRRGVFYTVGILNALVVFLVNEFIADAVCMKKTPGQCPGASICSFGLVKIDPGLVIYENQYIEFFFIFVLVVHI